MPGLPKKPKLEDEPTSSSRNGIVKMWDDPTTEDEASRTTRMVDTSAMVEELEALAKRDADKRRLDSERTPALGTAFVSALVEASKAVESSRSDRPARADDAPEIDFEELALSEEERLALEGDEQD